ncbi:MAG TPA: NTP transferase domain-containing protein [Allosphingosinicella sp.]|jgi:NDP-sugar pyrophosphorylase family protein
MPELSMVMPMAGRGSRFGREGVEMPKPLIDLGGRPFFWWATESLLRSARVREMVFVVLDEHVRDFAIERRIREYYPDARVVALPGVTSGAAETARIGVEALASAGPVAVNDCDHAFSCPELSVVAGELEAGTDSALLCFPSESPAYSYVRLDADGRVTGTVEKQAASPWAIAGCYLFSGPERFLELFEDYRLSCPYDELFVSGLYNRLAANGGRIAKLEASAHVSFGTPAELHAVDPNSLTKRLGWREA